MNNTKPQKNGQTVSQNSLHFQSNEKSYIDTLIMKLLKSSLEKENDDHDVFGAYIAMEMRNLKTSDAQAKLRTEIRDTISRFVREESVTALQAVCYPPLNEVSKKLNDLAESNLDDSFTNNAKTDDKSDQKRTRKPSWELIN